MSAKKVILLFTALGLPIAVFLFLKFFGKNEFGVPALFQDQVNVPPGCSANYNVPYTLPDTLRLFRQKDNSLAGLTVVIFDESREDRSPLGKQVNRLKEEFSEDDVSFVYAENNEFFATLKKCVFLLNESQSVALIDDKRRIRGLYDVGSLEEADRLMVELKIILKKY